jgi:1,2-diacylglycerol 3-beta-galactosyltransferase
MRLSHTRRTILFLISDTGAGHRSAANAVCKAVRLISAREAAPGHASSDINLLVVDAFAECAHLPLRKTVCLYGPVTEHTPRLYGQLFHLTNSNARFETARRLCGPFLRPGLRALIARTRPDVIVSIHPLLNHVTLQVLAEMDLDIPVITVVTDLMTAHVAWFARDVDACVVPTPATRNLARANGLPASRVHLLGMPIDPSFAYPITSARVERRLALHLDPSLPVVLLTGGGDGAGGLAEAVQVLAGSHIDAQLLVVTGHNRQLSADLWRMRPAFRRSTRILGFVRNMPDLMRASDVVVTKAGPGTISEAVACELPIVLTGAIPGQEEGNIDFVLQNGLGVLAPTPQRLVPLIGDLLSSAPTDGADALHFSEDMHPQIAQIRAQARAISRPHATFEIARLILSYAAAFDVGDVSPVPATVAG